MSRVGFNGRKGKMLQLTQQSAWPTQLRVAGMPAVLKEKKGWVPSWTTDICINDNKLLPEIKQLEKLAEKTVRTLMSLLSPLAPSSTLPIAQGSMSAPSGHQSLPQWCSSRTGLQLHTDLPCPAMGPTVMDPAVGPWPSLALTYRPPHGGAQCPGLGMPSVPQVPSSCLGAMSCPDLPRGSPTAAGAVAAKTVTDTQN